MTVTIEVIQALVAKFGQFVQPNEGKERVDDALVYKDNVQLVTYDVLGMLRSTVVDFTVCKMTGKRDRITCQQFFDKVFKMSVLSTILLEDVQVVVVCLDRYGARRVEKTATTNSRKRAREASRPECIPLPPGQTRYFEDDRPMPGELNDIFDDAYVKAEFYEYLTRAFVSERVRKIIPTGKQLILSCGVRVLVATASSCDSRATEETDPLEEGEYTNVYRFGDSVQVQVLCPLEVQREQVRFMKECDNSGISEGDLDAWYWPVYVFPTMNVHVHSYDSDVLFVGMMQIRRLLKDVPDRHCQFITRRSAESRAPTDREVRQRTIGAQHRVNIYDYTLEMTRGDTGEAYRMAGMVPKSEASSSSSVHRAKTVWRDLYFDIAAICRLLYQEASERLSLRGLVMRNPVEVNVVALILSSQKHDYIQPRVLSPGVGPQYVWPAFSDSLWMFSDMVTLMINDDGDYYYAVSVEGLRKLARAIYDAKGSRTLRDTRMPSAQTLNKLAAQCVWTLQYWGNGITPGYRVVDGTTVSSVTGVSVYGYTSAGWAETVDDDRDYETIRYCPMIEQHDDEINNIDVNVDAN